MEELESEKEETKLDFLDSPPRSAARIKRNTPYLGIKTTKSVGYISFHCRTFHFIQESELFIRDDLNNSNYEAIKTSQNISIFKRFDFTREDLFEGGGNSPCEPHIHYISNSFNNYYEELESLGEGSSAVVKRCRKLSTNEEFAVKIINFRGDDEIKTLVVHYLSFQF